MKKNKGITLVALIITIIIMLILIAVTVSLVVNSNLLGRAKNAGDEWEAAQIRDNNEANEFQSQITAWEQSICTHTWGDYEVTTQATCSTEGEKTRRCNNCGATQTEVIPVIAHVFTNGTGNCIYECGATQDSLVIGAKIVGYRPDKDASGNTISTSYTSVGAQTGGSNADGTSGNGYGNQTFDLASYEWDPEEEGAMEWRVLGEEDGHVIVTTADPIKTNASPKANMYFRGMAGYANFIDELDRISSIYGQGKYAYKQYTLTQTVTGNTTTTANGSGARSIDDYDLERIRYTVTREGFTGRNTAKYERNTGDNKVYKEGSTSGGQATFRYWDEHVSGGTGTWQTLTTGSVTLGNFVSSISRPSGQTVTDLAHNMIIKDSTTQNADYWLGSRSLNFYSGYVRFYARYVYNGNFIISYYLYNSNDNSFHYDRGVRPVVYLQSNINLSYDSTTQTYSIVSGS